MYICISNNMRCPTITIHHSVAFDKKRLITSKFDRFGHFFPSPSLMFLLILRSNFEVEGHVLLDTFPPKKNLIPKRS